MPLDVRFSFDPSCPWTWRTSRWLLLVAPERDLAVEWRPFSLLLLQEEEPPEPKRSRLQASAAALRLVEALQADGGNEAAGRFYTELGIRVHEEERDLTLDLVREAAAAAGVDPAPVDDPSWGDAVRACHEAAFASAGPDIGSPVIDVEGATRGLHGPVLGEVPDLEQSLRIWDCVCSLVGCNAFFELKRGRP